MKPVSLYRIRSGQKFWLFASDAPDDYLVRGPYSRICGKYVCWIRGSVLAYLSRRLPVYTSLED